MSTPTLDVWATAKPYWDAIQPFATIAALIAWWVEHRRSNARDQRERDRYETDRAYRTWLEETFTRLYGGDGSELPIPLDTILWAARAQNELHIWSVYGRLKEWKLVRRV